MATFRASIGWRKLELNFEIGAAAAKEDRMFLTFEFEPSDDERKLLTAQCLKERMYVYRSNYRKGWRLNLKNLKRAARKWELPYMNSTFFFGLLRSYHIHTSYFDLKCKVVIVHNQFLIEILL